jgi:predicted P-loop ATPase
MEAWLADAMDAKGNIAPNLANTLICLRGANALNGCLAFNEMTCSIELIEELPLVKGARAASVGELPRALIDADVTQVCEWLQRAYRMQKLSLSTVQKAIDRQARENRHHPIRNWLDDLIWDKIPRVEKLFTAYFGAQDDTYTKAVSKIFLISLVARIYQPGCQADYVSILDGPQGVLKSKALATLVGQKYFGDNLPDIHHKDSSQYLRGKWLIELGELATLNKSDVETLKAFITRRVEKYRPSFGHFEVDEPRQTIFAGSTNRDEFLRDTTGNRRFMPVATPKPDIEAMTRDRAMLFAEAVHIFKRGEHWWPDREFEAEHMVPRQEERVSIDEWEQPIREFIRDRSDYRMVTSHSLLKEAIGMDTERMTGADGRRIADIMRKIGWRQDKKKADRPWLRPEATEAATTEAAVEEIGIEDV